MDQGTIFIGFFLTALFIGAALWHIRENAKLESSLLKKTDEQTAKWIMHFAWSRTLQLLAALGCAIVIFINYDKALIDSQENLDKLTEAIEKSNQLEGKSTADNKHKTAPQLTNNKKGLKVPAQNPVVAATLQTAMQEHIPPGQEVILPPAAIIAQQKAAPTQQQPVVPPPQPAPQNQRKLPLANIPANVPEQAVTVIQPSSMRQGAVPPPVTNNNTIAPAAGTAPVVQPAAPAANYSITTAVAPQASGVAPYQIQSPAVSAAQPIANAPAPVDTTPAPIRRSAKNEAIEALYDPEKNQTDKQSGLDDIKKRYEDIIVIYLFLKKCNKTQAMDLSVINNALTQEVAAANAPAKLQNDIMTAARGSYNEIYAKSSCDGKSIGTLVDQYNNYVAILGQNYPLE